MQIDETTKMAMVRLYNALIRVDQQVADAFTAGTLADLPAFRPYPFR